MSSEKLQVYRDHYEFNEYVNFRRWASYYYQIKEVISFNPKSVLEIGVGAGITRIVLEKLKLSYDAMDIDRGLNPTIVASILENDVSDSSYDVVCCFQVLEHIEFSHFKRAISEIFRIARNGVVISLPDSKRVLQWSFWVPVLGNVKFLMPHPLYRKKAHVFDGEHHWEINKRGHELNIITMIMEEAAIKFGFNLKRTYRLWESPKQRFFVYERSDTTHKEK